MMTERGGGRKEGYHARRVNFREPVQRFLIVTEGEKTEKLYFEAFKVPKDVRGITVRGLGLNTVSLVREAIKIRDQADEKYDQVWCIFDVEDYRPKEINEAIQLAKKNDIQVAVSNQAFELWYLLHFNYYSTAMDRRQYIEKLCECLEAEYEKNICIYQHLVDLQETAIRNAKRLLEQYERDDPARNNPSTGVHHLVEELNRFSAEKRAKQR